jgi:hypothetical protein
MWDISRFTDLIAEGAPAPDTVTGLTQEEARNKGEELISGSQTNDFSYHQSFFA